MKLLVVRHGEAQAFAGRDEARKLTAEGRAQVERTALQAAAEVNVDAIFASPFVRAQETADLLAGHFTGAIRGTWQELVPESQPEDLCNQLLTVDYETVCLASHQPFVGKLVQHLTGDAVSVATGSAFLLVIEPPFLAFSGRCLWRCHAF